MGFAGIVMMVVFVVSSLLLILFVLAQNDQGESLGGILGGGSTNTFGVGSGNILTKITTVLGTLFLICSFGLAYVSSSRDEEAIINQAKRLEAAKGGENRWWDEPDSPTEESSQTQKMEEGEGDKIPTP